MSKIRVYFNLRNLVDFDEFRRYASAFIEDLVSLFNGKIEFVDNIKASGPHTLSFDGTTGQVIMVEHTLGKIPLGHLTVSTGVEPAIIKRAGVTAFPWTDKKAYFTSNLSTAFDAVVYIV